MTASIRAFYYHFIGNKRFWPLLHMMALFQSGQDSNRAQTEWECLVHYFRIDSWILISALSLWHTDRIDVFLISAIFSIISAMTELYICASLMTWVYHQLQHVFWLSSDWLCVNHEGDCVPSTVLNTICNCCALQDFERSRAFSFLSEVKKRFQTTYGSRAQTALPYAMNSEFSSTLAAQMVSGTISRGTWVAGAWESYRLTSPHHSLPQGVLFDDWTLQKATHAHTQLN